MDTPSVHDVMETLRAAQSNLRKVELVLARGTRTPPVERRAEVVRTGRAFRDALSLALVSSS